MFSYSLRKILIFSTFLFEKKKKKVLHIQLWRDTHKCFCSFSRKTQRVETFYYANRCLNGCKKNEGLDTSDPKVIKHFFMLNSTEHEIFHANKSQITNNCKFFLAKHS